jgi:AraC-like DNA-binding protein
MTWKNHHIPISLSRPPRIIQMGFATFGRFPEESFQITPWTLHLYFYRATLCANGVDFPIRYGYMGINPSNAETHYRFEEPVCRHIYVHFEVEASLKTDLLRPIPSMCDINNNFDHFSYPMNEMLKHFYNDRLRSEVILWDLLYRLVDLAEKSLEPVGRRHPALNTALEYVATNLSQYLPAASVASAAGISQNHLNRLFKANLGKTIKEYINDLRMEKAAYFLTSTRTATKNIAWECGIPDLQHFNKTVRRCFGAPPTEIRKQGSAVRL